MTPAGTSNELDVQNEWEENTTHCLNDRFFYSNRGHTDTLFPVLRPCSHFVFINSVYLVATAGFVAYNAIMQEGVSITPQEAMEPGLNKALTDYE